MTVPWTVAVTLVVPVVDVVLVATTASRAVLIIVVTVTTVMTIVTMMAIVAVTVVPVTVRRSHRRAVARSGCVLRNCRRALRNLDDLEDVHDL